jgi:glycerophosphoryl diester phosphodiesterase
MRRLLDAGVDAIITDRPDILRAVLLLRGDWAPMTTRHTRSGIRSDSSV